MAFVDTVNVIIRVLINDMVVPYVNSDSKIEQVIMVAAYYVQQDIAFTTDYTIDVVDQTISPDPVDIDDQAFINFVALKSACLLDQGSYRVKTGMDGLSARCGMASLSISGQATGFKELLKIGACGAYDTLKKQYQYGDTSNVGFAIFSPFISDTFNPSYEGTRYYR